MRLNALVKTVTAAALALGLSASAQAFFVNASGSYNGKADIDGVNGEVATSVYRLTMGNKYFTLSYKHTSYDFSGVDDPFDSLNYLALDGRFDGRINHDFGFFTGLTGAVGFEKDINISESYAISPRAGLSYSFDKSSSLFLGAAAQFNEVDDIYLPIIGVQFGSADQLGWSGSVAYPATKVTFRPSDLYAFEGIFLTVRELYQLADDSSLVNKGYIFEESYGASVGVIFTPIKLLELRAGVQSYFEREYTIYSAGGHEMASYDVDPSVGGYLNFNLRL